MDVPGPLEARYLALAVHQMMHGSHVPMRRVRFEKRRLRPGPLGHVEGSEPVPAANLNQRWFCNFLFSKFRSNQINELQGLSANEFFDARTKCVCKK